ncbi:MAG TPA: RNA polymerase sigma factor SigF, partial [Rugosimonospora sp.]|nr:RNA polymerase sigma factor SigF [Rugosimonospora sp.]
MTATANSKAKPKVSSRGVPNQRRGAAAARTKAKSGAASGGAMRSTVDETAVGLLKRLASLPVSDASRVGVREAAIEAWLPLARHLAQRFHGRGEPVDDLVQ